MMIASEITLKMIVGHLLANLSFFSRFYLVSIESTSFDFR